MASLNIMVQKCAGLIDTKDISMWEDGFLANIYDATKEGKDTRSLTEAQIDKLTEIYERHFA